MSEKFAEFVCRNKRNLDLFMLGLFQLWWIHIFFGNQFTQSILSLPIGYSMGRLLFLTIFNKEGKYEQD